MASSALVAAASLTGHAMLLVALALAAPAFAAILWRPQLGVLAVIALVPFDGLLGILPHPVIVQGWKEALTAFTLAATFVCPSEARGSPRRELPSWTLPLALLVAVGVTSAVVIGNLQAFYGLKIYFFFTLIAIICWRCPLDARERDRLVSILMLTGVVVAAWGIVQQFIGPARLHAMGYEYNTTIRTTGPFLRAFSTFSEPFGFGYFVMIVILVCLPVALADRSRRRNQLFLLALPVLGFGLVSTFVRGAWLGLAVGVAFLGRHHNRTLLLTLPLALVALLFLPADISRSALSTSSSAERAQGWREQAVEIVRHPLGNGIGTTGATAEKINDLEGKDASVFQPDNYYFLVTYELGPLGLWTQILFLAAAFGVARRASRDLTGPDRAFAAGTTAFVVAAATSSLVASFFQIFPSDVFFWTCLTVVAAVAVETRADATAPAAA